MFTRRIAKLAAAFLFALTLALPFTPSAHAQAITAPATTAACGGHWSGYWTFNSSTWQWNWTWYWVSDCSGGWIPS